MKYLLLICADPSIEASTDVGGAEEWVEEMDRRRVRLEGHALRPASEGRSVRVRDGRVLVGDGPFVETKEQVGGFDILECASLEEAVEVAAKHPAARFGTVEVRAFQADYAVTGATVEVVVRVGNSPEEVWDLITDVSRIGEWSPECTGATWLDEGDGPAVGRKFEGRNRFPDGRTSSVICEVTEVEPGRRFAWAVLDTGGWRASLWSYDLTPDSGQTIIKHTFVHTYGNTGLRQAILKIPGDASAILEERLARLRVNMTETIRAMTKTEAD
ncbi:SRPBCC family protein [Nonomuraea aurantiaca]|uniref:SRPBCC family protein n=1 Tax=Nonomuraea aurantiaca TaxID=2878562 RepID=UPI001CD947F5|nr:SRPBCC family protein [Nonomuraea aurantiaca]MCA2227005.1 SRPBCC family protein [Nonomuraea aurantiaca]